MSLTLTILLRVIDKMKLLFLKHTLLLTLLCVPITFAKNSYAAACVTPVAVTLGTCSNTGAWDYDTANSTYRYCNGTNYISMQTAGALSSCAGTTAGTLDFDTGINNFKFCDGTDWIGFSNNGDKGACATAGLIDYNTSTDEMEFCNGTAKSSAIETIGDAGSLSVATTTWSWQIFTEYGAVDSGAHVEEKTITVTNNGACDLSITSVTATPVNDCTNATPFYFCLGLTPGFAIVTSSSCSGVLLAGNTCNMVIRAQIIIPSGGVVSTSGTLTINTSTYTNTSTIRLDGCDEVGANAQNCT